MLPPEVAVLRFGLGARPGELQRCAHDPRGWLLEQTVGTMQLTGSEPPTPSEQIFKAVADARFERHEMRETPASADAAANSTTANTVNALRDVSVPHYRAQVLARARSAALTTNPFAERLVHFWSNHFAVSADKGVVFGLAGTLENEAIRPHVNGRFIDMLTAAERHPAMLAFLDNQTSAGADSEIALAAARRGGARVFGINENLAREILELHTLGVNGGYTQADVTSFAQIISGWSVGGGRGRFAGGEIGKFYFRESLHEPGAKRFLGKTYSDDGVGQGDAVLDTLAHHPATAHFIATKLARHFIADDPPQAAVARIAHAFSRTGGDLPQVYRALLDCPEAWEPAPRKFKTPQDFVFSALRSFDVVPSDAELVVRSFASLGQRQFAPSSPAGWPDTSASWDGSDALMHRISWASKFADRVESGVEPLAMAAAALGAYAREATLTAVRRAASGAQALTLLLLSPEFQRR